MGLFVLSHKLMQTAERALPEGKTATSVRIVMADVFYHPDCSITEITERTGFPQSLVSTAVAKLREVGAVETRPDPSDGRRTVVRASVAHRTWGRRPSMRAPVDAVVSDELAPEDQGQLPDVLAALELLARLLVPEVVADDDPRPAPSPVRKTGAGTASRHALGTGPTKP
jgi:DNA-binding transcriptional ArsR family regulator